MFLVILKLKKDLAGALGSQRWSLTASGIREAYLPLLATASMSLSLKLALNSAIWAARPSSSILSLPLFIVPPVSSKVFRLAIAELEEWRAFLHSKKSLTPAATFLLMRTITIGGGAHRNSIFMTEVETITKKRASWFALELFFASSGQLYCVSSQNACS